MLFTVIAMMVGLLVWFVSAIVVDKDDKISTPSKRFLLGTLLVIYVLVIPAVLHIRFLG